MTTTKQAAQAVTEFVGKAEAAGIVAPMLAAAMLEAAVVLFVRAGGQQATASVLESVAGRVRAGDHARSANLADARPWGRA